MVTEVALTNNNIREFLHLIPQRFWDELISGELVGVGGLDIYHDFEPVAVLLCRENYGWMEIVWLASSEEYRGSNYGSLLLWERMTNAERSGRLHGVFTELPEDGARSYLEREFRNLGFRMEEIEYPVYTVSLGECREIRELHLMKNFSDVIPLEKADSGLKGTTLYAIKQDERSVPLPDQMDWTRYDQKMSVIYAPGKYPQGLLLFERENNTLTMRSVWTTKSAAIIAMLSYAVQVGEKECPEDLEIVIPAVTAVSEELVRKLISGIQPLRVTQARKNFGKTAETEVL